MGITIEDGTGKGFTAVVDSEGHLVVDALTFPDIAHVSDVHGQTFSWSSRYLIQAGSSIIFLRNVSTTRNFFVTDIDVGATSGATWEIWTSTTAGAGVVISGTNFNRTSSNTPDASAFGNENITTNGSESLVAYVKHGNNEVVHFDTQSALILGQNDAIMVKKQLTPASTVSGVCTVTGYFE